MKILLKTSVAAAALLTGAGLAMAQDTGTAGAAGAMGGDITCAQIVELDSQEAERALYFLAGRQVAQGDTGVGTDTTASTQMDTSSDTTAGAAGTDTGTGAGADTTTSADAGTDTTGTAVPETDTDTTASADDMGTDTDTSADITTGTEADTMAADDTTGADMGTDTTTTAGTGATGGASDVLSTAGYFEIPVDAVMTACEDSPETSVSEILRQESGGTMQ